MTSTHLNSYNISLKETYNISEEDFIQINKRSKVEKYDIFDNAKFLFIDFNGEYLSGIEDDDIITDKKYKNLYSLTTRKESVRKFPISEDEINDDDFWAIFLTATEKTQKPFLKRALSNRFYFERLNKKQDFKYALSNIIESLITKKVDKGDLIQFLLEIKHSMEKLRLIWFLMIIRKISNWHSK